MKPTYVVIFTSRRRENTPEYDLAAERIESLMRNYDGFLSIESVRGADGFGITVCLWESLEAIKAWKDDIEHRHVQERGKHEWYESYKVKVCKIEYEYDSSN
jgi:heme-degrading monooxygenase HmoA